jgi:flagellar biosynthesis/type III secretory pathway chaperone
MSASPSVADVLRAEIAAFEQLCRVLDEEHTALVEADADRLLSLSEEKARVVEHLRDLAQDRSRIMHGLSLDPHAPDFSSRSARLSGTDAKSLATLWNALLAVAGKARDRNHDNGELLAARMTHNRAALETLNSAARRHSVYGPDGQNVIQPSNRTLGQA